MAALRKNNLFLRIDNRIQIILDESNMFQTKIIVGLQETADLLRSIRTESDHNRHFRIEVCNRFQNELQGALFHYLCNLPGRLGELVDLRNTLDMIGVA